MVFIFVERDFPTSEKKLFKSIMLNITFEARRRTTVSVY